MQLESERAKQAENDAVLLGGADDAVDLLLEPLTLGRILRTHADSYIWHLVAGLGLSQSFYMRRQVIAKPFEILHNMSSLL